MSSTTTTATSSTVHSDETTMSLPASSIEVRLAALEALVGKRNNLPNKNHNENSSMTSPPQMTVEDVSSRLDSLHMKIKDSVPASLLQSLEESNQLLTDFHPGPSLTYQKQPVGYRRQEVLASSDNLQDGMSQLNQLLDLLLIGSKVGRRSQTTPPLQTNNPTKLTEHDVVQAPILTLGLGGGVSSFEQSQQSQTTRTNNYCSPNAERQLDLLLVESLKLQSTTEEVVGRVDALVQDYNDIMIAAAEKILLASEQVEALEKQRSTA
eukprot:CAMPEP_0195299226 /NCGR_PEP_ID=MMETSP0707-20130614/25130_1 /TAXON_ID=33640 /ORGANISM="Asterionellopsis glacialis, Strain CCMP134" /LENGTH=265 /DNA_ID=CAMNT_0040361567 /DNA_START=55 /DNA_END=852 /DNA_ORIENTATION=-